MRNFTLEFNAERISWIRKLSKGAGLMRVRADTPLELFGADDWLHLVLLITWAKYRMPRNHSSVAILTALNLECANDLHNRHRRDVPRTDLKERRGLLSLELEVSERTIMRLEEEGAEVLSDYLERTTTPLSDKEIWYRWSLLKVEVETLVRHHPMRKELINVLEGATQSLRDLLIAPTENRREDPPQPAAFTLWGFQTTAKDGDVQGQ